MSEKCKILVADPDPAVALSLAEAFRAQGWSVITARDVVLAQALARKDYPAAIVLSSQLPAGGAITMLKRIRNSVHTVSIPVIAKAAPGGPTKKELLAAGASDCLDSPTDAKAVVAAICRHLDGNLAPQQPPRESIVSPDRRSALAAAEVLDTPPTKLQDSITHIAATLLGVPVALLSIVDEERQFFKSQVGLPEPWSSARQTPLSHSFCQWVVSANEELLVEDARKVPGLHANLAIRDLGVIAYAGVPVLSPSGPVLGSFCAIDSKPRIWNDAELANLRNLARMAEAGLVAEKSLNRDSASYARALNTIILNAAQILRRQSRLSVADELLALIESQAQHLLHHSTMVAKAF